MINNKVIVRSKSAGVFFGELVKTELGIGMVEIKNSRRLWYWSGAASLSQLAVDGTSNPSECKFPVAVESQTIMEVIEIIPCTNKAIKSIEEVKVWNE